MKSPLTYRNLTDCSTRLPSLGASRRYPVTWCLPSLFPSHRTSSFFMFSARRAFLPCTPWNAP